MLGTWTQLGLEAKLAINRDPAPIPNEVELLRELRAKVGPHSNNQRLLFHIRSSRGKLHWAVNSYFREVLCDLIPGSRADFLPPTPPSQARAPTSSTTQRQAAALHSSTATHSLTAPATPGTAPSCVAASDAATACAVCPTVDSIGSSSSSSSCGPDPRPPPPPALGMAQCGITTSNASNPGCKRAALSDVSLVPAAAVAASSYHRSCSSNQAGAVPSSPCHSPNPFPAVTPSVETCSPSSDSSGQKLDPGPGLHSAPDIAAIMSSTPAASCSSIAPDVVITHRSLDSGTVGLDIGSSSSTSSSNDTWNGCSGIVGSGNDAGHDVGTTGSAMCDSPGGSPLELLPNSLLEGVMQCLDVLSLCKLGRASRALHEASLSNSVWGSLFASRWGAVHFPTDPGLASPLPSLLAQRGQLQAQHAHPSQLLQHPLPQQQPQHQHQHQNQQSTSQHQRQQQQHQQASHQLQQPQQQQQQQQQRQQQPQRQQQQPLQQPQQQQQQRQQGEACTHATESSDSAAHPLRFAAEMRCPRCGTGRVVPLVYGFPSLKLMDGMSKQTLILGGDHLIEDCHDVSARWHNEAVAMAAEEAARRLAREASSSNGGGVGAAGGGGGAAQQQGPEHPRVPYTYEL
ncbi:MAG: hypothetical protein WDW38_000229 [Sanguina aurantia]